MLAAVVAVAGCEPTSTALDAALDVGVGLDTSAHDAALADARDTELSDAAPTRDGGPTPVVTTIRVRYSGRPGALSLRGGGGPLSWTADAATTAAPDSVWVFTTTEITSPIEWKPVLDGSEWARGPNYHVAPGDTIEVEPHFEPAAGRVVELLPAFGSAFVRGPRIVWAYLPPGYDENTAARWPVVYAQDGQNFFDPARAFGGNEWMADETMDSAAETGRCGDTSGATCSNDGECGGARCDTFHAAVIVAPEASPDRLDEYTPTVDPVGGGGRADDYLRALDEELAPLVNSMLRVRTNREHTTILGSSLGGLLSAYASVVDTDRFARFGVMSPSTWWDGRAILGIVATLPTRSPLPLRVYVDSGDSGPSNDGVTDTAALAAEYGRAGLLEGPTFHYVVAVGHTHSEPSWARRLPGAFSFLLGRREESVTP